MWWPGDQCDHVTMSQGNVVLTSVRCWYTAVVIRKILSITCVASCESCEMSSLNIKSEIFTLEFLTLIANIKSSVWPPTTFYQLHNIHLTSCYWVWEESGTWIISSPNQNQVIFTIIHINIYSGRQIFFKYFLSDQNWEARLSNYPQISTPHHPVSLSAILMSNCSTSFTITTQGGNIMWTIEDFRRISEEYS